MNKTEIKHLIDTAIAGQGSAVDIGGALPKILNGLNNATQDSIAVTWAELKALRDAGTLDAGKWYRITDYVTTTAQEDTRSAGHQFDILVHADTEDTLNENAYACRHADDEYFADANLAGWQLLYSLDNTAVCSSRLIETP